METTGGEIRRSDFPIKRPSEDIFASLAFAAESPANAGPQCLLRLREAGLFDERSFSRKTCRSWIWQACSRGPRTSMH